MKIQFIEKIKEFFEKRKLKKLPDEILEEKVEQNIDGEETGKLAFMVGAIGDEKTQIELAKKIVEAPDISTATKAEMLNELPKKNRVKIFKDSISGKKVMAKKNIDEFFDILIKNKELKPYDEIYYRIDEAFSDTQLIRILKMLAQKRPEAYDEEKVLRIVAKQIDINVKKHGIFFPSHAIEAGLFEQIVLKDEKAEKGEREFDILNPQDKQKLFEAMKEERDEIRENSKVPLSEKEEKMLNDENLEKQINQLVQFKMKRQEELQIQNSGKSR